MCMVSGKSWGLHAMKKNSGFKYTSSPIQFRKSHFNFGFSSRVAYKPLVMHQFIHTLRFLSEGDSPEGPAKECDDFCKDSALIIFGEMVNPCSCSVKIRSSWLYYFNAPYFQGFVPLGESGSGLLICRAPFKQIHFQISDLSNPLWTRIHRITDLRDLRTDHWITDPTRSLGRRIRN